MCGRLRRVALPPLGGKRCSRAERIALTACVACACACVLYAQTFSPPVPAWPVGKEALLKALSDWVHAEADAVLFAAPGRGGKVAKLYVKLLKQWAGRIGGGQGWAIPRVGAGLREAARAVSSDAEERFDKAVALYRREVNKESASAGKGRRTDARRARQEVEVACAVCAHRVAAALRGRPARVSSRARLVLVLSAGR